MSLYIFKALHIVQIVQIQTIKIILFNSSGLYLVIYIKYKHNLFLKKGKVFDYVPFTFIVIVEN